MRRRVSRVLALGLIAGLLGVAVLGWGCGAAPGDDSGSRGEPVGISAGYELRRFVVQAGPWNYDENVYLLVHSASKQGLLIDPGARSEELEAYVRDEGVRIGGILNTHAHYDHIGANALYRDLYQVDVYASPADAELYRAQDESRNTAVNVHAEHLGDSLSGLTTSGTSLVTESHDDRIAIAGGHATAGFSASTPFVATLDLKRSSGTATVELLTSAGAVVASFAISSTGYTCDTNAESADVESAMTTNEYRYLGFVVSATHIGFHVSTDTDENDANGGVSYGRIAYKTYSGVPAKLRVTTTGGTSYISNLRVFENDLLALGSSICAGYAVNGNDPSAWSPNPNAGIRTLVAADRTHCFPYRLGNALDRWVENHGVGGDTIAGLAASSCSRFTDNCLRWLPEQVILDGVWTNDVREQVDSVATIEANITAVFNAWDAYATGGQRLYVLGAVPRNFNADSGCPDKPGAYADLATVNSWVSRQCMSRGYTYIDAGTGMTFPTHFSDTAHPYASGYQIMADNIEPNIVPVDPANAPTREIPARGELRVGELTVRVIPTPGHTPGSVCFLIGDMLLSGDTLFRGSVGRTKDAAATSLLVASIRNELLVLPPDTVVHSGHGDSTTIGFEAQHNAFLQDR